MSDGSLTLILNSALRRLSFSLANRAIAVTVGTPCPAVEIVTADDLAQFSEPDTCPCKLNAENCEANRDDNKRWPGSDDHDNTERDNSDSDYRDRDPSCQLVCHVYCLMYHNELPADDPSRHYYLLIAQILDHTSPSI